MIRKFSLIFLMVVLAQLTYGQQPTATLRFECEKTSENTVEVAIIVDEISSDIYAGGWYMYYDTLVLDYAGEQKFTEFFPEREWVFGESSNLVGFNWIPEDLEPRVVNVGDRLITLEFNILKKEDIIFDWFSDDPVNKDNLPTQMYNGTLMEYLLELKGCEISN